MEKICKTCGESKSPELFRSGRRTCKACDCAKQKARYEADPDKYREAGRRYYHKNQVECRDRHSSWYAKNREARAQYNRVWRTENSDYHRMWRQNNRDKVRKWQAARYAREAAPGKARLKASEWQRIKEAYGHRCAYCGCKPTRLEKEHVIPLASGGPNVAANVVPVCSACNDKKRLGPAPPFQRIPIEQILGEQSHAD